MNILVYPMFSRTALNADSCYVMIRQTILAANRLRKDVFWDIFWPNNTKDWQYYRDGLFDLSNVRRLPLRFHPAKMKQVVSFSPFEVLQYLDYKYPSDVIWNFTPEIGDILRNNIATYDITGKAFVVNNHNYIIHKSLPYPIDNDQTHVLLRQLVGSYKVDRNLFISDHCRQMFMDNAQEYLAPSLIDAITPSMVTVPNGTLDVGEMDRNNRHTRDEIFTFAYNHRLQTYKQYKTTFEQFERLHQEGLRFKVVVFGVPGDIANMSYCTRFPFVEAFISSTRDEYLQRLSMCHANTLNSMHETFCISAVESMYYGQLLIAPNGITFPEITGHQGWLFESEANQYTLMARAIQAPDQALIVGARLADHVRRHYTSDIFARNILSIFDELAGSHDVIAGLKNPTAIVKLIRSRTRWNVQELRREVYSSYDQNKLLGSNQSFPVNKIIRLARQLGYHDARDTNREPILIATDARPALREDEDAATPA
jgi:glycosyltransferase involved in cell wall biosynthesis